MYTVGEGLWHVEYPVGNPLDHAVANPVEDPIDYQALAPLKTAQ